MNKFKIGDRVIYDYPCPFEGCKGTIVYGAEEDMPGVEFDISSWQGHDCDGHAKDGHGWWVFKEHLVLLSRKPKSFFNK